MVLDLFTVLGCGIIYNPTLVLIFPLSHVFLSIFVGALVSSFP